MASTVKNVPCSPITYFTTKLWCNTSKHALINLISIQSATRVNPRPLPFLLLYNDLGDVVKHTVVLKHADDTVVYISGKIVKNISSPLSIDLSSNAKWFKEKEIPMDLKQD